MVLYYRDGSKVSPLEQPLVPVYERPFYKVDLAVQYNTTSQTPSRERATEREVVERLFEIMCDQTDRLSERIQGMIIKLDTTSERMQDR